MKRIAAIALSVVVLMGAFLIGRAAADSVSLGNSGVEFRAIDVSSTSSSQGESTLYQANCPAGFKAVGGGAVAFRSPPVQYYAIEASYPLDADTWAAVTKATTGATVRVHVICANLI